MNDNDSLKAEIDRLQHENMRLEARLQAIKTLFPSPITFKKVKTEDEQALLQSEIKTKRTLQQIKPKKGWSRWIKVEKLIFNDPVDHTPQVLAIETDVSELKQRDSLLKNITKNLDDFASLTSHDLQAPLRHIGIFSEMLENGYARHLDETGNFYLKEIRAGVENMRVQIDGFLRFMQGSPTGIVLNQVDITDVFREAHLEISETLKEIGGTFSYPEGPILVQGDAVMLNQAIRILLDNCIKYRDMDRPLSINITHTVQAELIEISVIDNGQGIAPEHQDSIFSLFGLSRPLSDTKALSVGLALCRRIMVFHGGEIKLKPRENGACFSLDLKIAVPEA